MMHALKPSFFRPTSRPSSPAPLAPSSRPDPGIGTDRPARPLHKLSLGSFRKALPAPPTSPTTPPTTLIQDGSYLEMLSLKLSEAVSKALAQPTGPAAPNEQVAGKRPIPAGRGRALVTLIATELRACHDNPHLYRASLRSLNRPLSVLVGTLSTQLVPLLASPALLTFSAPATTPNATQLHAFAIAAFAGELVEFFDETGLGSDSDPHGLKTIKDGLVSVVNRVINPVVTAIRNELGAIVDGLEVTPTVSKTATKLSQHPSLSALQSSISGYARVLERCISLPGSQTTVATLLISLVWRGLVGLSHRPYQASSPPASPSLQTRDAKKRRSSSTTPPLTPPSTRFTMKLPPSRPPSPPLTVVAITDAHILYDLLSHLPRPSADKESSRLAREAVEEAFTALHAFGVFVDAVHASKSSLWTASVAEQLVTLGEDVPTLIALSVVLHAHGSSLGTSVPQLLKLDAAEYKKACLTGFGRAEEIGSVVGQHLFDILYQADPASLVAQWLELELATEPAPSTNSLVV